MKILAVMGSPKGKGSGYRVVQMIEKRMKELGDVDFEYLFLKDANLQPCKGCFACVTRGENLCPLKDDRAQIEQKLLASDGVILSTPGYVQNVSWLMKNFIDRFAYSNHRPVFHRQKVLPVANSGGAGLKEAIAPMRIALGGAKVVHELGLGTPPWPVTEKVAAKNDLAVRESAEKLYRACLNTALPKPGFNDYVRFVVQQRIGTDCREWLPADYEFYKGKAYYYDAPVSPLIRLAASVMLRFAFFMMRDMGPGSVRWPPREEKKVGP
ncbi:MAG: Iron-sulfur flavoprotein [Methanocella sp. PtaU1.Bin125]|nr:MAG: Iron-sulfur flavoprotein [Methanocella sp. PtaU1.Bin125]